MKKVLFILAALALTGCEKDEKKTESVATDVADSALSQDSTATTVDVPVSVTPDVLVSESDAVTSTSEVTPTK